MGNIVKIKQGSAGGWLRKIIEQHPKLHIPSTTIASLFFGTQNKFQVLYHILNQKKYTLKKEQNAVYSLFSVDTFAFVLPMKI